jgi:hypothetical protein
VRHDVLIDAAKAGEIKPDRGAVVASKDRSGH